MQGYDVNRASKRKPLRIWVILSPAVVSGAQFGRQRQKLSKELYNAGWRLSRLFRVWEPGTPTGAPGKRCGGVSPRRPFIVFWRPTS